MVVYLHEQVLQHALHIDLGRRAVHTTEKAPPKARPAVRVRLPRRAAQRRREQRAPLSVASSCRTVCATACAAALRRWVWPATIAVALAAMNARTSSTRPSNFASCSPGNCDSSQCVVAAAASSSAAIASSRTPPRRKQNRARAEPQ